MAIKEFNLNNDTIFVSVRAKGVTITLPLNDKQRHSARIKDSSLIIYQDGNLVGKVMEVRNFLTALSAKSLVTPPSNSTFAVPSADIAKLTAKLDQIDAEVGKDLEMLIDNYDDIKEANKVEVQKAIETMDPSEKAKIMKRFEYKYPSKAEIKAKRQLLISIMASPLAGEIANLDLLRSRVEEDAQVRYKEAVFMALDPIYKALGTYYTKRINSLDVGTKSKNFFNELIYELKEQNLIRRDGFTSELVGVLTKHGDTVFEDSMLCYNLLLNIKKEARECDVEGVLSNMEKLENNILNKMTAPKLVLGDDLIDDDLQYVLELKDL